MVRIGSDETNPDESRMMAETSEQARNGFEQMLEDMEAMAADRESAGYETLTVTAGDTTPKPPAAGEDDEWGLSYIVPGDAAESFEAIYERADFEETGVYQARIGPHTFLVTECLDHDAEIALFVAGSYQVRHAGPLVRTAMEEQKMYTHVKTLDQSHLGTIEHGDAEAFFPNPEEIYAYETDLPGGTETDFS